MKGKQGTKSKKSNARNANILIGLAVVLIAAMIYQFVYVPLEAKKLELEERKSQVTLTYDLQMSSTGQLGNLLKQEEELASALARYSDTFYGFVDQEEFIFLLNNISSQYGLTVTNVTFLNVEAAMNVEAVFPIDFVSLQLPKEAEENESSNITERLNKVYQEYRRTTIEVNFKGSYDQLYDTVSKIKASSPKICLAGIEIDSENVDTSLNEALASKTPKALEEVIGSIDETVTGKLVLEIILSPLLEGKMPEKDMQKSSGDWNGILDNPFDTSNFVSGTVRLE